MAIAPINIYPVWVSPRGNIAVYNEGETANILLQATGNDSVTYDNQQYRIVSGHIPAGLTANLNYQPGGTGTPKYVQIVGTVANVNSIVNNSFTIRANVGADIADAGFNITVYGQNQPEWTGNAFLGNVLTGEYVGGTASGIPLTYIDTSGNGNITINISNIYTDNNQTVPRGLRIDNSSGNFFIRGTPYFVKTDSNGNILPLQAPYGWDRYTVVNYVLELSDGVTAPVPKTFQLGVYAKEYISADADHSNVADLASVSYISADNQYGNYVASTVPFPGNGPYGNSIALYSADMTKSYKPFMLTVPGTVATVVSNNFFATQFQAFDITQRTVNYECNVANLTSYFNGNVQLDANTGYLYGRPSSLYDNVRTFQIRPNIAGSNLAYNTGDYQTYSVNVQGRVPSNNRWITQPNLGVLINGETSELKIQAVSDVPGNLIYTVDSGQLPPGLVLSPTGLIVGRVPFNIAAGDTVYTFTARASDPYNITSFVQQFSITLRYAYSQPYNNLYLKCYPPAESRSLISSILGDVASIPYSQVYRYEDPNFGIAKDLEFLQAVGLTVRDGESYFEAMSQNHYRRFLTVGSEFKSAVAKDANENVLYEVVYCDIIDNLENSEGVSVGQTVAWPVNTDDVSQVYPNSLDNMRERIYSAIGQQINLLPQWMRSRQSNGRIPGYQAAWVLCYVIPGSGTTVTDRLNRAWGQQLNLINFDIDRYVLDQALTYNYHTSNISNSWVQPSATAVRITSVNGANNSFTFANANVINITNVLNIGDSIGSNAVGGLGAANLANIGTYTSVVAFANAQGLTTANLTNDGYVQVAPILDTVVVGNVNTLQFNGSSANTVLVVNTYSSGDKYNKYLLFPQTNIID